MTINKPSHKERLRDMFNSTVEDGTKIQITSVEEIDYYVLLCKSMAENKMFKMFNCNFFSFLCEYEGEESVIFVFAIPTSNQPVVPDKKHSSEKIMDILKIVEECFVIVDYMSFKEVREDKFIYITIIKKIKESEE